MRAVQRPALGVPIPAGPGDHADAGPAAGVADGLQQWAARHFVEEELVRAENAGERAVVITHHAPSRRSIRRWFQDDPLNPAFASDLDRLIERYQPALWVHGHMHDPADERLGKTRLVANPVGYAHERKRGFDPTLCINLEPTAM